MRLPGPLDRLLDGGPPVLPRPADALAERWARLRPRTRMAVTVLAVVAAVTTLQARVVAADGRWGGRPTSALVATADLTVGTSLGSTGELRRVELPPASVPPGALDRAPGDAVLAYALPRGAVLTRAHIDPRGPAAGLAGDMRAVPVPVEDSWGVSAGGWVDVWVLGAGTDPAVLIARSRPLLEVREDGVRVTALVGLHIDEVGPATTGLALGRVLLAHAPPPNEQ
jgi:hypothetical protein